MLTAPLAHAHGPPTPQELWSSWNTDPVLIVALLATGWIYWSGRRRIRHGPGERWRTACFAGALATLGIALVSPLDAASTALASAHMVQHVLLILVAAPLLALSAPATALLLETPIGARRLLARLRRRVRKQSRGGAPYAWVAASLLHAATVWVWHAAVPYDAALDHRLLHVAEHASFFLTGLLFWHVVIGPRGDLRVVPGLGILVIFAMALQSTFLSVLLTFSRTPWYAGYAATTQPWGLAPLADQQLAGVIMWVPAGFIYLAAALSLLIGWMRQPEEPALSAPPPFPHP